MVSIDGHEDVPKNNEQALMKAVANQPVAVAIDAGEQDFQFYKDVNPKQNYLNIYIIFEIL